MGISYPSITYKYDDVGFITKQQKERVQLSEPQTNQNTIEDRQLDNEHGL